MAIPIMSAPLFEKVFPKNTYQRAVDIALLFLLLCLLIYRLLSLNNHGLAWFLGFLCELWFTINWIVIVCTRWTPMLYKPFPERLQRRVPDLPPVDVFVTTADTVLEPPILTVNTVLSLLAVDYPANKLACYVSDDGCSPLIFYCLSEATKFAKHWVPFCRKYNVQVRAPFRYFMDESTPSTANSNDFQREWKYMKEEYEQLSRRIENAAQQPFPIALTGELAVFSDTEQRNHPTILKVLWENKEGLPEGLPHLIYVSREKRPKNPHYYKAGAMNVLTRVSGLMTNAPFMLNLDCDMFVNNTEIFRQAMCLMLGSNSEKDCAYIQCPQLFYDRPQDLLLFYEYIAKGIVGIQGPYYGGTGGFHRRKVIYGLWPDEVENQEKLSDNALLKECGNSKEFITSAVDVLKGKTDNFPSNPSKSLETAHQVASCSYEYGTGWGKKFGWIYGSLVEDILTGLTIHIKGWRSGYCSPDPPAFLGCAPPNGPAVMVQQKRWATGVLEIFFSKHNPIIGTLNGNLQLRQCLAYYYIILWGFRPIFELCYATLPAYCILTNSNFLPKVQDPGIYFIVAPFVVYYLYTLSEFIRTGFSVYTWWVSQCMARIVAMTAWLFGVINVILKLLVLSEMVFEITEKGLSTSGDDEGKFVFNESPVFVSATTVVLVHLTALATCLLGLQPLPGLAEFFCSVLVLVAFWPFVEGLFRKGKYGIPLNTIYKSSALALFFVYLCKM
ncbi:cellulose synthase-like protein B4 isoform X2 [Mangifera indica]|uniref:cellulose synthase-like protein B4 isoform X2 n=1 Tax=Mangifera indica TaxID=29780 RepID=UPI001CFBB726|nr:cellulose synthase-like protein B4 isoform X2 [Mangifera indica]